MKWTVSVLVSRKYGPADDKMWLINTVKISTTDIMSNVALFLPISLDRTINRVLYFWNCIRLLIQLIQDGV